MKFIHTADLHIGNKIHDIERVEEYNEFFAWFKNIIIENNAQALIISGDIFDTNNPSVEARKIFFNFLASLNNTCCKNIIIVGGNHDSGALIDSMKEFAKILNIHMIGSISDKEESDLVFKLYGENNEVSAICAAIPYVKEIELRHYYDGSYDEVKAHEASFALEAHKALYDKTLNEAKRIRGSLNVPIIATGHLHAANLEGRYNTTLSERPQDGVRTIDVVGNLGYVGYEAFSKEYDYIALGHIHYHSKVNKENRIRYSGSPFIMGFDEASYKRKVLLVDCTYEKDAIVQEIEVPSNFIFKRIEGDVDKIKQDLNTLETTSQKDKTYYVQLRYKASDRNAIYELASSIKEENINIVSLDIIRQNVGSSTLLEQRTMRDMRELKQEEIFTSLILSKNPDSLEIESLNEEEKKKYVNKYLHYFLSAYDEVIKESTSNENN